MREILAEVGFVDNTSRSGDLHRQKDGTNNEDLLGKEKGAVDICRESQKWATTHVVRGPRWCVVCTHGSRGQQSPVKAKGWHMGREGTGDVINLASKL